jgi:membrane fusion protein, multidrug efflux system
MTPDDSATADTTRTASDSVPRAAPRRARWRWIATGLVLLLIAAGAWYWWPAGSSPPAQGGRGRPDQAGRPLPVVAAPAKKGSIDVYLNGLGTVTPRNMVVVRSRVDGQLVRLAFREGDTVKQGDLLAEIDPRPFQVQLTQAQGQMAKDQALLANAKVDLERYRTLLSQDSISKQQVDTQESLVRQYQGAIEADQGQIDNAKLQLTYSRITAPITGRIGLRQVDPGNMIHASDTNGLVVITQLTPITVIFTLPEDSVPRVMKRLAAGEAITVDAFDRDGKVKLATGKLITVDNQIDTATGTVKLKAEFPNTDSALFPNQFVNARMGIESRPDATLVPTAAVQRGAPGTFVFVVNDDRSVSVRPVKLGPVQGEVTAIDSGVAPGDMVVVDGADKLREGAKVELVTREAQASGAPAAAGAGPPRGNRSGGERAPSDGTPRPRKSGG